MPRIRTIKPEFWADEKLAPLSPVHRLVFLGLISMADDAGRLLDNVKSIDGFVFPDTDDSSRESLNVLAQLARIERYTSESGQRIIQVVGWSKHQRVDKPSRHCLPAYSRESRECVADSPRSDLGPRTNDLGSSTNDRQAVVGVVIGQPMELALQITIAANHAVTRKWGEQTHPYIHGQSYELAQSLIEAGVPLDVAKASVVEQVERSGRTAPPRSINWFRPGIITYHHEQQQKAIQAANPSPPKADALDRWLEDEKAKEATRSA